MSARSKPTHKPTEQPYLFVIPALGETFGRLTIVGGPQRNAAGRVVMEAVCSCRNATRLTKVVERFTAGAALHCGCLADTRQTERRTFVTPSARKQGRWEQW